LERCRANDKTVTSELALSLKSGRSVMVQMVSTHSLDASGSVVGFRTALTDISERKRAEESLRLSVRMREDFLAIVSHDLRNPLNSIFMNTDLLLRAGPP